MRLAQQPSIRRLQLGCRGGGLDTQDLVVGPLGSHVFGFQAARAYRPSSRPRNCKVLSRVALAAVDRPTVRLLLVVGFRRPPERFVSRGSWLVDLAGATSVRPLDAGLCELASQAHGCR